VDAVLIFNENTPEAALEFLKPDIHCKGAEYAPPNGKAIPEKALVESYGGRVEFLPLLEGISTTDIVNRISSRVIDP
jgi:bifunctional ADP-heptose synthase (sugar kinase/adenylyltransferase)